MKLLLIMPNFFNYPELITDELQRMGYEVDFFDDRPSTNAWIKAAIRVNKDLVQKIIKTYFEKVMMTVRNTRYDIVFVISGQSFSFSESMVRELKESQSSARFILYQWDSQANFPYIKKIQNYFEKCYSFDKNDVDRTPALKFLPLFYSRIYEDIGKKNKDAFEYDFCFIGTAHPKKYKFIRKMSEQLSNIYPSQFVYFYFPSRIVYFYRKILNKELHRAHISEFHFKPLKGQEMNEIYEASRCVLDSAQDGQQGLTIRVIEALGAKKKIITTNEDIVNYDFYKKENIYIYKDQIDYSSEFFTLPYCEVEQEIYRKYSLRNWLTEILS